jgi:predicted DsbA family dithiol-disulfide isomerase
MQVRRLKVEFFHDVLCAWCYALSPRLRRLVKERPWVEVVHRCFALAPTPEAIILMFGSKERGKREILGHWRAANANGR